jgi:hypothetical protein
MNDAIPATPISPLRQRLIDDMNVRRFSPQTKRNYIRDVGRFTTFLEAPARHGHGGGFAPLPVRRNAEARRRISEVSYMFSEARR